MRVIPDDEVDVALDQGGLAWAREVEGGPAILVKHHAGRDFAEALAYVNAVGALAEKAGHHPDIDLRWNRVVLRLSTHSAGGITTADLDLAAAIDSLTPDARPPSEPPPG